MMLPLHTLKGRIHIATLAAAISFVCGCSMDEHEIASSSSAESTRPSKPLYRVTDLGTLGGSLTRAIAINNAGDVIGMSGTSDGGPMRPFLWKDGHMRELP